MATCAATAASAPLATAARMIVSSSSQHVQRRSSASRTLHHSAHGSSGGSGSCSGGGSSNPTVVSIPMTMSSYGGGGAGGGVDGGAGACDWLRLSSSAPSTSASASVIASSLSSAATIAPACPWIYPAVTTTTTATTSKTTSPVMMKKIRTPSVHALNRATLALAASAASRSFSTSPSFASTLMIENNSTNNNSNNSSSSIPLAALSTALIAATTMASWTTTAADSENITSCEPAATVTAAAATTTTSAEAPSAFRPRPTATSSATSTTSVHGLVYPSIGEDDSNRNVDPKISAEADVRRWEDETARRPFLVSEGALQGARWTMEDRYLVENGGHFVAIFDGHGGSEVSERLRGQLYELYTKNLPQRHMEDQERRKVIRRTSTKKKRNKMEQQHDGPSFPSIRSHTAAIRGALRKIEREVLRDDDLEFQGSTCVAVLVHTAEDGSRTLLSANVGDSRAVLSRGGKAVDLTRDHKPSDEKERARIRSMGEDVQWDPWGQIYRVRDLSLSRAIGDRFAKPIVSSEAEITQESIRDDEDEFFLLASDGLFDVMTSQEVVDFVRECLRNEPEFEEMYGKLKFAPSERREHMAEILANEALERGSADNVCVIVVWLKDLD